MKQNRKIQIHPLHDEKKNLRQLHQFSPNELEMIDTCKTSNSQLMADDDSNDVPSKMLLCYESCSAAGLGLQSREPLRFPYDGTQAERDEASEAVRTPRRGQLHWPFEHPVGATTWTRYGRCEFWFVICVDFLVALQNVAETATGTRAVLCTRGVGRALLALICQLEGRVWHQRATTRYIRIGVMLLR